MIEERLRAHVDSLARPVALDDVVDPTYTTVTIGRAPLAVAPVRGPRALRRPLALAAAVVAVLAAVAFVVDDRQPTLVRPGAWSVVPEATATFAAVAGPDRTDVEVRSVVPYDGGLVAVGSVTAVSDSSAAVWRSADGLSWARVLSDSFVPGGDPLVSYGSTMGFVTVKDGRLVVLGMTIESSAASGAFRPAVWTSDDGLGWQRHELPGQNTAAEGAEPPGPMPSALVATPNVVLAFLTIDASVDTGGKSSTRVFSSPDGVAWSPVDARGLDEPGISVFGAVVDRGRVVVFGSEGGANGRPAAWTSADDGTTWQPLVLPFESELPTGAVSNALSTPSGLLLLGTARTSTLSMHSPGPGTPRDLVGDADAIAWLSRDGSTFEALDTAALNTGRWNFITAATRAGNGALVTLNRMETTGETTHVVTWSAGSRFVEEEGAAGLATVTAMVDDGGAFIAMARASNDTFDENRDLSTVVWRAPHR